MNPYFDARLYRHPDHKIIVSFKHGVLDLTLPKKDKEKLPEKKQILIEG